MSTQKKPGWLTNASHATEKKVDTKNIDDVENKQEKTEKKDLKKELKKEAEEKARLEKVAEREKKRELKKEAQEKARLEKEAEKEKKRLVEERKQFEFSKYQIVDSAFEIDFVTSGRRNLPKNESVSVDIFCKIDRDINEIIDRQQATKAAAINALLRYAIDNLKENKKRLDVI